MCCVCQPIDTTKLKINNMFSFEFDNWTCYKRYCLKHSAKRQKIVNDFKWSCWAIKFQDHRFKYNDLPSMIIKPRPSVVRGCRHFCRKLFINWLGLRLYLLFHCCKLSWNIPTFHITTSRHMSHNKVFSKALETQY